MLSYLSFEVQEVGVIRKVFESVVIEVLVELYLYSFLIIRFDLIQVGLPLEVFLPPSCYNMGLCRPPMGLPSHLACTLGTYP
jgi:hypothetical protein